MMKTPQYKWEKRHSQIFKDMIESLNASGIRYFILRNYEGLPESNESKDVDIIIEPGTYKTASDCMYNALHKNGVPRYYVVKYERVRCWLGMDLDNDFSIHIDLIEGYLNKGFEIFSFDELYCHTQPYRNMMVLDDDMDAAMLLLYKVIGCKELKPRYREKIETLYCQNPKAVNAILSNVLTGNVLASLTNNLECGDFDNIIKSAGRVSRNSKCKAWLQKPVGTTVNIIKFLFEKTYRIGWCPKKYQKMIAVEAPDGTGKTTFIDAMSVKLAEMFVTDISKMNVYHFRPTLLPNLGAVGEKATAGKVKQDTDFTNPHRNPPANPISSFIRMVYYWFDYVIGGFAYIRKDVQFDKFTIFDRYIYDFIVDPCRSRINLPLWLRKIFARCVYKPQLVFVLLCDADIVYKRKQELTKEEIKRQMGVFRELTTMGDNFCILDASQTPDKICYDAVTKILEKYTLEVK